MSLGAPIVHRSLRIKCVNHSLNPCFINVQSVGLQQNQRSKLVRRNWLGVMVRAAANPSKEERASDLLMCFRQLQPKASGTNDSWDEDGEDDLSDTGVLEAACCNDEGTMSLRSLAYLWRLIFSSALVSMLTAGWLRQKELVSVISLPRHFLSEIPQFFGGSWPPALTLLAILTILAIIIQPEGYTWMVARQAGYVIGILDALFGEAHLFADHVFAPLSSSEIVFLQALRSRPWPGLYS